MTIPVISDLPEIPAYSDASFETKAPAVLSALRNAFIAEMNAAIAAINSYDYGAAVNISKVVGLTAGRIPYGAGTAALANRVGFALKENNAERSSNKFLWPNLPDSNLLLVDSYSYGSNKPAGVFFSGGFWDNANLTGMVIYDEYITATTRALRFAAAQGTGNNTIPSELTTLMSLMGNGYVGIGTTAPAKKLEVEDATGAQARLTHSSGNYTDFQTDGDGNLTITPSGRAVIYANEQNTYSEVREAGATVQRGVRYFESKIASSTRANIPSREFLRITVPNPQYSQAFYIRIEGFYATLVSPKHIKYIDATFSVVRYGANQDTTVEAVSYSEGFTTDGPGLNSVAAGTHFVIERAGTEAATEAQEIRILNTQVTAPNSNNTVYFTGKIIVESAESFSPTAVYIPATTE